MDSKTWNAMVEVARSGQEVMMAEGMVPPPVLWPFRGGKMIGSVTLRPVHVGEDAMTGVAEMSALAAAAGADEIIVMWETSDLAAACGHSVAPRSVPSLMILWASAAQRVLYEFPYQEREVPGRTAHGLIRGAPDWSAPLPGSAADVLEPAIAALADFCFQPLTETGVNAESAAAYLESQGYAVRLVKQ